jgi:predicted ester cyclase
VLKELKEVLSTNRGHVAALNEFLLLEWLASFHDLHFDVEPMIAEDDRVMTQSVMRGTHTGAWLGIAPSNKNISISMMVIHRISSGKIIEDWVLVEALGFYQTLGLLPATEEIFSKQK